MQIGIVGLGRMGANIARRLMRGGQTCVVYDHAPEATQAVVADGATGAADLGDLVQKLAAPRSVWLMLPAGKITEDTLMISTRSWKRVTRSSTAATASIRTTSSTRRS